MSVKIGDMCALWNHSRHVVTGEDFWAPNLLLPPQKIEHTPFKQLSFYTICILTYKQLPSTKYSPKRNSLVPPSKMWLLTCLDRTSTVRPTGVFFNVYMRLLIFARRVLKFQRFSYFLNVFFTARQYSLLRRALYIDSCYRFCLTV